MVEQKPTRYIGIVQFRKDATPSRIAKDVPKLVAAFERFSRGDKELVFRSNDGHLFAFVYNSTLPLGMMTTEIGGSDATVDGDSYLITEMGKVGHGTGTFTRALAWLQHH